MKTPGLILTLSLGLLCVGGAGCKKNTDATAEGGPAVFGVAEKNQISAAIDAKKYDAALEALAKLRDKITNDKGADEYRALMNETMTRLRILSGSDESAKVAFDSLAKMATGR